ncbi:MAG: hypothetical protein BZ135_01505 [Methanosphaera sp. rholeuAM6]|nr:MAG: hypothetical protein BZ135_01505 [Methanosphaera sp. rholeuAM6]
MIILKAENNNITLYIREKKKTKQNRNKISIQGQFTLKEESNQIEIKDMTIEKYSEKVINNNYDLLYMFKNDNVFITNENDILINFLNQEKIEYKIGKICERCCKNNKIKILTTKDRYTYNDKDLCRSCAEKTIKHIIYRDGFVDYMNNRYELLFNKYQDINKIINIMEGRYNPVDNPELTLYDTLPATEGKYEKIQIKDLTIPEKLKKILMKRVDTLLPVQVKAIKKGLLEDENLLVVSQTASGKTLIGELAGIPKAMNNKKMIYLSPLVALANQKYRDFKREYGELGLKIVIKVGQNRIKAEDELYILDKPISDANIIVATYEGLDYILRSGKYKDLKDLGIVVIDEIHMLENEERGHRLNGLINRLMTIFPETQIIGLSATIGNAESLAKEFNMKLVEYDKRPVKIERHFVDVVSENQKNNFITSTCKKEYDNVSSKGFHGQTIIFTDSRRKTHIITNRLRKNGITAEYYHAGLSYSNKVRVEEAFLNQEISTVVTTSALSNGVDFPASTVIFESLRMGIDWLTNNEFHQMLGRAGRPMYHDVGKVYIVVNEDNRRYYSNNEYYIAMQLLRSNVDNINVLYDNLDVYEQVLSDICAIENVDIDVLKKHYDSLRIPITFEEAVSLLLDKNMIIFDNINDTYHATEYGKAISKSFINVREAEHIRSNLYNDTIDTVLSLEKLKNAYFSHGILNKLCDTLNYHVGARLFSDYNKELIYRGDYISGLAEIYQNSLINIYDDFMNCSCDYNPYCSCLEMNISSHIIERRLQGWNPSEIAKEFNREYNILIYSGDIYSYLDQVIMKLEAIRRISEAFNVSNTTIKCKKLIEKIENGE